MLETIAINLAVLWLLGHLLLPDGHSRFRRDLPSVTRELQRSSTTRAQAQGSREGPLHSYACPFE